MNAAPAPKATVSLVTWNATAWLDACLDSVAAQTIDAHELLIVDNASHDGTTVRLRQRAAADTRIRLIELRTNLGYGRAHNINIRAARGPAVLLLNQDVVLDAGFLEAALQALDEHPRAGAVQGRIHRLRPDGARSKVLDTTGLTMGRRSTRHDPWSAPAGQLRGDISRTGLGCGWAGAGVSRRRVARHAIAAPWRRLGDPRRGLLRAQGRRRSGLAAAADGLDGLA